MRLALALLLLAAVARAEGIVVRVTAGEKPVAGAGVKVLGAGDDLDLDTLAWAPDARTDDAGQAAVDAAPDARVMVFLPGWALAVRPVSGAVVDVALRPERIFKGRVMDTEGAPVSGALVHLKTTARQEARFHARTDAQGRFFVYALWLDDYELYVEAPGYSMLCEPALTEEASGGTFVLRRPGRLAGRVVDEKGAPQPGFPLYLCEIFDPDTRGRVGDAETDAEGRFEVPLPGGRAWTAVVEAAAPWGGASEPIRLAAGEVRDDLVIVALRPALVRGRVVDEQGAPLKDVEASAAPECVVTDEEGRFEISVSAQQHVSVCVDAREYQTLYVDASWLAPGAVRDLGDLVLRKPPLIEVVVTTPAGVAPAEGTLSDEPLVDGRVRVPEGDYLLKVPGFPEPYVEVEAPGPVEVMLHEPRWIDGLVVDEAGTPVAGARITGDPCESPFDAVEVQSDADGHFRLGPLPGEMIAIEACAGKSSATAQAAPGEGVLELTLRSVRQVPVRGVVLRGERPVRRFSVEGTYFVDEDGRFDAFVEDTARSVRITVDGLAHTFARPEAGDDLVARLPAGSVEVVAAGAGADCEVRLYGNGSHLATQATDDASRAVFADLPAGRYRAEAEGYAPARFDVADGPAPEITLVAVQKASLRILAPAGVEPAEAVVTPWPGDSGHVYQGEGAFVVSVDNVHLREGEERVLDLAPPDAGVLVAVGPSEEWVDATRTTPDLVYSVGGWMPGDGTLRIPLPPGPYVVWGEPVRIRPGRETLVVRPATTFVIEGRVLRADGKSAQGATVYLTDYFSEGVVTDLLGRFRIPDAPAGEYALVAELEGWGQVSTPARVTAGGEVVAALPLVLREPRGRARLVGPAGEPLADEWVLGDGAWLQTNELGEVELFGDVVRLDGDYEGLAPLRGRDVRDGEVVRLPRGAGLVVLVAPEDAERVEVLVGGRPWRRLDQVVLPVREGPPGRLELTDLPPGPVEVVVGREEPRREVVTLVSGGVFVLDLSGE